MAVGSKPPMCRLVDVGQRKISRRLQVVLIFLLHRHCDIRIRGEPDLVALQTSDEALVDEMMVAFVGALAAIPLRQLDAPAFDLVHRANMDPVGADHFHMFLDFHFRPPLRTNKRPYWGAFGEGVPIY
jgi:hypothetical protein